MAWQYSTGSQHAAYARSVQHTTSQLQRLPINIFGDGDTYGEPCCHAALRRQSIYDFHVRFARMGLADHCRDQCSTNGDRR